MALEKLLFLLCFIALADSYSVVLEARAKLCFGQYFEVGKGPARVIIQISKGGETDINYQILDPYNNIVKAEDKIQSESWKFNVTITGQYQVCLDNSPNTAPKVVMVEFNHFERDSMHELLDKVMGGGESVRGMKQEFKGLVKTLLQNSERLERLQEVNAAKKRRHYFLVLSSLARVNGFSLLSCILMIGVGVLQVFIVKGLFDENRKPFKFW